MNSNSENPKVGRAFQNVIKGVMEQYFNCAFIEEKPVMIGNPPHPHKFDVVSEDGKIIVECKCYTWTKSGNVPSAKLATLDEAILYMRSVSGKAKKIIAIKFDKNEKKNVTLAEYFCEKKGHLLEDVEIWEVDDWGNFRIIKD